MWPRAALYQELKPLPAGFCTSLDCICLPFLQLFFSPTVLWNASLFSFEEMTPSTMELLLEWLQLAAILGLILDYPLLQKELLKGK